MTKTSPTLKSVFRHYRMSIAVLKRLFKDPLTKEECVDKVKKGLKNRENNFLIMLKKCVFENPKSPYMALLENAGYTFNDVKGLVESDGLEGALVKLCASGVYIDAKEYKGKKAVVRGDKTFNFNEGDFNNPLLSPSLETQTGGTTGRSTNIKVPLEYISHNTIYGIYASSLYDIPEKKVIVWLPILPALEGLFFNLRFGVAGNPPVKWYSQIDGRSVKPSMLERLKTTSTILLSRYHGVRLPKPEFVDINCPDKISEWMSTNLNDTSGFAIVTYASSAFRLVTEAKKKGIQLGETVFWLMGEPLTEKKHEVIESYGCKAYTLYGCNELMLIGHACLNPEAVDEIHVCTDKLACIQHRKNVEQSDKDVDAFLFTTLLDFSPKIFLNTEIGDYGVMGNRDCGCPFEEIGLDLHMHTIRSYDKLTAEGMTFVGGNIIPLVEEILPQKFGGSATDYQFMEEEDNAGYSRLFALVSPEIGNINEEEFKETVINGLFGEVDPDYTGARAMKAVWSKGNTITIIRDYPLPTSRGKIMPFFVRKDKVSI